LNYEQSVIWSDFINQHNSVGVSGLKTMKEAREQALELAKNGGWTPPKWWQWWRWNDTPNWCQYNGWIKT